MGYREFVESLKGVNIWEIFDEYTDWQIIYDYIAEYNHYLVYLKDSTWNCASGHNIVDSAKDVFYRSYDTTIEMVKGSSKGKYLICKEYSHDKPTGYYSIIIGLTDSEYKTLNNHYYDYGYVENFVKKFFK